MKKNVGLADRALRGALGLFLVWLAFFSGLPIVESSAMKIGAAVIGVVMLVTAFVRICPIYSLLGLRTCQEC